MRETGQFPDFKIVAAGPVSGEFLKRQLHTFKEAAHFIQSLPYGRNSDREDPMSVFRDACGTCSTKHALLKMLADENNFTEIKQMVGIFKMSAVSTPSIAETLNSHQLEYIPEAHSYLRYGGKIFDFTKPSMQPSDFENQLLEEIEINPKQIGDHKITYHKGYLQKWLVENPQVAYSLSELWRIREQCILDLSK